MLFQIKNPSAERVTHCGVLEFVSDEGTIYIHHNGYAVSSSLFLLFSELFFLNEFSFLYLLFMMFLCFGCQMMENMLLQEGDIVKVKIATLAKGTYVKLQPHTKDFFGYLQSKSHVSISSIISSYTFDSVN